MGAALHMVAGAAASGTAGATVNFTAGSGDSFAVRNFAATDWATLEQAIGQYSRGGDTLRIISPMFHDDVQGIRLIVPSTSPEGLLPLEISQKVLPQDTLVPALVQASAEGASVNQVAALGFYYSNLPTVNSRLRNPGDVSGIIKTVHTVVVPVAIGATAGNWASASIDSALSIWHANTDYAVLGWITDTAVCAIAVRGDDTNNLRCGGPGVLDPFQTRNWFLDASVRTGQPHVPIINSANKDATFVDVVTNAVTGTVNVCLFLAELSTTA